MEENFQDKLNQIKEFDFFSEGEKEFYGKLKTKSVLVQGQYWENEPLITVVITTYKRPSMLKLALESALNQEGFDDYQVLIVDNEAADIDCETDTSKLVSRYASDKIIYFRNIQQSVYRTDTAVCLSKSKWICVLHDDDFLSKNHLAIMSKIVSENPQIYYLSCPKKVFHDNEEDDVYRNHTDKVYGEYSLINHPFTYYHVGYAPGWLGALIDRKKYIGIGGMPSISTGVGDHIMQGKFAKKWGGIYELKTERPLYHYRISESQDSATGNWAKMLAAEFLYYQYIANERHSRLIRNYWKRMSAYIVVNKFKANEKTFFCFDSELKDLLEYCSVDDKILNHDFRYYLYMKSFYMYKKCSQCISRRKQIKGTVEANS